MQRSLSAGFSPDCSACAIVQTLNLRQGLGKALQSVDLEAGDESSIAALDHFKANHSDHHCSHEDQRLRLTRGHRYQSRAWAKTG